MLSISLGSRNRDHSCKTKLAGEKILIERRGTDGDVNLAQNLFARFDGHYDAFGIGGMDLYIFSGGNRYKVRGTEKLIKQVEKTPVVDGSGLKNTLERQTINYLKNDDIVKFKNEKALVVSAVDRFGMAETLEKVEADLRVGDFLFVFGIPLVLNSLNPLSMLTRILAPLVVRLPLEYLYPVGNKQEKRITKKKYTKHILDAKIIAGDFHFIKRFSPLQLKGKIIITNTVTKQDINQLKKQGVKYLITTTPELNHRSFGTNVLEAVFIALSGKRKAPLTEEEYYRLIDKLNLKPRVEKLN